MKEQENRKGEIKMNIGKQIRKFRRNMRAISPVIATLLMIAIAVVASLVTYAWVMGYMNFQTEKTGKAIQIQSVANSTTAIDIYVQNVGDSAVEFNSQSVYVDGANIAYNTISVNPLAAGDTTKITVPYDMTITPITLKLDIKVTTEDGTYSTQKATFP
jgi:archaeal type IV pilus assembly protein PilA